MKSNKLTFTAIAASLILPIGAYAGCGESHAEKSEKHKHDSSTTSVESHHMDAPHASADRYSDDSQSGFRSERDSEDSFAMGEERQSTTEWRSSSSENSSMRMTSSDIKKVEKSELRDMLKAEDLVGKTVVDRDGEEIGEVHAIALTSLDEKGSKSRIGDGMASSFERSSKKAEVHVYVESSDGETIFEVPMSELTFDDQQEELSLDMAESDLDSLSSPTTSIATTD